MPLGREPALGRLQLANALITEDQFAEAESASPARSRARSEHRGGGMDAWDILVILGRLEEAVRHCDRALELNPATIGAYLYPRPRHAVHRGRSPADRAQNRSIGDPPAQRHRAHAAALRGWQSVGRMSRTAPRPSATSMRRTESTGGRVATIGRIRRRGWTSSSRAACRTTSPAMPRSA